MTKKAPKASAKNEGARIERKAIRDRIKRMIAWVKKNWEDTHYRDGVISGLAQLDSWIHADGTTSRAKRTAARPGGLGRK